MNRIKNDTFTIIDDSKHCYFNCVGDDRLIIPPEVAEYLEFLDIK